MDNFLETRFSAKLRNVVIARAVAAAFLLEHNLPLSVVNEIKTIVSEAVTNAIVHGYENRPDGIITITAKLIGETVELTVEDQGVGIEDVQKAREPLFTTKPDKEHSGMGFTIMENFVNELHVETSVGKGTKIRFVKTLKANEAMYN